jgi:hypothetical protein
VRLGADENPLKRAQIITVEGREVVGLGYSVIWVIRGQEHTSGMKEAIRHGNGPIESGTGVEAKRRHRGARTRARRKGRHDK